MPELGIEANVLSMVWKLPEGVYRGAGITAGGGTLGISVRCTPLKNF